MKRDIETKEYRFNEARHLHQLLVDGEWKNLTGCTTVLSVLAKPQLIQWAANLATARAFTIGTVVGLKEEIAKYEKIDTEAANSIDKLFPAFKEARLEHRKKKEKAGDWGTEVHAEIEKYIFNVINNKMATYDARIDHFIKWAVDNKVRFLESEKCMYSKELFIGGICDILCEIDGKLWMADVKTGSGIYPEAFAQMAGYELMMQEMGYPEIMGSIVLNLKKDGTFEEKRSISNEDSRKLFLACLQIYRSQEKLKSL